MMDRFLLFLLKLAFGTFLIIVFIVCVCSGLIIRWNRWRKDFKMIREMQISIAVESYEGVSHSHRRGGRGNHSHEPSPTNPSQEGYFVENVSETGSSSAETGKVLKEDKPPLYDFPPDYESLFPSKDKSQVTFVNEANGTLPPYVPSSSSNNAASTTTFELHSKCLPTPNDACCNPNGSGSSSHTNSNSFSEKQDNV